MAVVMGAETSKDRFAACKSMLDYGFANFALVTPEIPQDAMIPVKMGVQEWVRAVPGKQDALLVDKAQRNSVTTEITLDELVTAPVSQGQRLGTMTVRCGEQVLEQIPLVAEQTVPRLSFGQIFLHLLKALTTAK